MKIVEFEDKYRDDMIFMVLEAKNALGVMPRLNSDLLDIRYNYFEKGTKFWIALDDNDRVIGCLGYEEIEPFVAKLHRFYVKCTMKRQGIGSALLEIAEKEIKSRGYREILAHLGGPEFNDSKKFYPVKGYVEYQQGWMRKIV